MQLTSIQARHGKLFWSLLLITVTAQAGSATDKPQFNRDVRPILSSKCFTCHGFDAKKRQAELRLDVAADATKDRDGYRVLSPGNVDDSEMWKRIVSTNPDEVMPPPDTHEPLTDAEKTVIRKWIETGAEYQKHWSFEIPVKPTVPEIDGVSNPIDAFLQDRLRSEGLNPSAQATKESLVRRVTLDLTGLPPTLAQVDAFVADKSDNAFENLVERLQKQTTYGEHMARYWLDQARYADTHGLHLDNERSMWPYRDWVVRALNQNIPFDEFTRWQLAGDLLEKPTQEQLIASGFNRCNVTTSEGGSIQDEWIYRYAVDRTSTTAQVWMGLTAGCAVCHDHKFDPLTTKEYYSMYAFFHSAADPAMDGNIKNTPPILKIVDDKYKAQMKSADAKLAEVDAKIDAAVADVQYEDPATLNPPPKQRTAKSVWFEDAFPQGATARASGAPLQLVKKGEGEVFSGEFAIRRKSGPSIAQDFYESGAVSFTVPRKGRFFVHCFLDKDHPPQAIMVQFHTGSWKNRVVWGKQETIGFGAPNTTEKVYMGKLPKSGEWVRLEFTAKKVGLKPGTKVSGYAFTQFDGTVTWDNFGVESTTNPAKDSDWSWKVWSERPIGQIRRDLPDNLKRQLQGRNIDKWKPEEVQLVKKLWFRNHYAGIREQLGQLEAEKAPFNKQKQDIEKAAPITFVMADLKKPRDSFVMMRGAYDKPGEKVSRSTPAFLPPLPDSPKDRDYNRLDLANWLVSGTHPLTARVTVNRVWQQFFGTGLVKTSEDFGTQGNLPSHPELLDWLAIRFVEDGWDMKKLVRRIVTSHAYQQSTRVTPELLERDPENRLLARGPRLRLDAEMLRDQALFVSGLMVPTIGGPGVKPYQPPNIWEPVAVGGSNTRFYKQDKGDALYRRSLYTFFKRTAPPPYMSSFDAPNREQSCSRRGRSNTPLQALQLMNDVQHVEAARQFATRIVKEGGDKNSDRIHWAWRTVTSRAPTDFELRTVSKALEVHLKRYVADEKAAAELLAYGESRADETITKSELAAWTMVANLILNLDESICKN